MTRGTGYPVGGSGRACRRFATQSTGGYPVLRVASELIELGVLLDRPLVVGGHPHGISQTCYDSGYRVPRCL